MRISKYGAKRDANHREIVEAFEKMGIDVLDLADQGGGCPDLVIGCFKKNHLVEIKNKKTSYGRRGLNKLQKEWASRWQGSPVHIVTSVDEAVALINRITNQELVARQ